MLDILKKDAKCGDGIKLYLTSGEIIEGVLTEFNESNIVLNDEGVQKRFFQVMIGGWEIIKQDVKKDLLSEENITSTVEPVLRREDVINDFDLLYKEQDIDIDSNVITNATILEIRNEGVVVELDNGQSVICHKGYMVGFSRANCVSGKRAYCSVFSGKKICYRSIVEMTYGDLHSRLIKAVYNSPLPRIPIVESIITYFKNNFNLPSTKSILFKIRNSIKELNSTDRLDVWQQIDFYKNKKQYDTALDIVNNAINACDDNKQKVSLLLKKAQLYSIIGKNEDTLFSYENLISFCESIDFSSFELSLYCVEYAKLLRLTGQLAESDKYLQKAMLLNPSNKEAKKLTNLYLFNRNTDIENDDKLTLKTSPFSLLTFSIQKNVDCDVLKHDFTDPEIKSLNGKVTDEIAHRILDNANISGSMLDYLEAAKAFKELPVGSYDSQELEESVLNYQVLKSRSLFNSYKKIIIESSSIEDYSIEALTLLKDSAICYYLETIDNIGGDNVNFVYTLLEECLKMELSLDIIKTEYNKEKAEEIFTTFVFNSSFLSIYEEQITTSILLKISFYSVRCINLWNLVLLKSELLTNINTFILEHPSIATSLIKSENTTKTKKLDIYSLNFFNQFVIWENNWVTVYYKRFNNIYNLSFDVFSLNSLIQKFNNLAKQKYVRCLCESDKKIVNNINDFLSTISLYQSRDAVQRREILDNSIDILSRIINWNSSSNTILGEQFFIPLLKKWKNSLQTLSNNQEDKKECLLTVSFDPPYFSVNSDGKYFNIVVSNNSRHIAESYRLAIWNGEDRSTAIVQSKDQDLFPNSQHSLKIQIPTDKWGDIEVYELKYAIGSKFMNNWSKDLFGGITISQNRTVEFTKREIKWRDQGKVSNELFKGRDEIVAKLKEHYSSNERYYSYVLYGLSRTGKSCILEFLKTSITGTIIHKNDVPFSICPLLLDLGSIYGVSKSYESFWDKLLKKLNKDSNKYLSEQNININIASSSDFDHFINELNSLHVHPLFMFDEFSYMKSIIDDGYMNSAFLQYMRKLAADEDMASFIFAGTYDIKGLIHDSKYNISGAFNYLKEPDKPIFEISESAAEELINIMGNKLIFTNSAIKYIHSLSGDVPYWIQKICLNCGYYAVENNKSDIGVDELEHVVKRLTGESIDISDSSISTMSSTIFDMTQTLPTDPLEVKLILTTVAYLTDKDKSRIGVTHERMKELWSEYNFDYSKLNISEAIKLLLERKTFSHEEKDQHHYYRYSLELFRRWWLQHHYDIGLELTSFAKKI